MTKILVTGGAGFIGSHIVEHLMVNTDWEITVLDRLNYAGYLKRLAHLKGPRLKFVYHDFRASYHSSVMYWLEDMDYVIHNGAETHVERSLSHPEDFVMSNLVGTFHTLDAARHMSHLRRFIYVSTDEVHGPAPVGVRFKEDAPLKPSNPYSSSKAGGELLAYSWWKSYGLPVTITRTMNVFGERQHPEKFVPLVMQKLHRGEEVTIHANAEGIVGSRHWLHARNQADALLWLLKTDLDPRGETYHIAGEEHTNLEIAEMISEVMVRPLKYSLVDFHDSRPGHDLRYALDDSKLRGWGWQPPVPFRESLVRTVKWTLEHQEWLEA